MTIADNIARIRSLFPSWNPSPEESEVFAKNLRTFHQDDVKAAIDRHKADSQYPTPTLAGILEVARALNRERVDRARPTDEESREYESTQQWIKRTIESATPEEIEAVHRRVPMSKHMPGLVAAGIETIRKERRWR